jgi:hypothetical protein
MKKRCIGRRGYFFLIDSLLGLSVLSIGIFLIFALFIKVPSQQEVKSLSEDMMDFFAGNQIKDINREYSGVGGQLWNEGYITNSENTLLQQVAQFYENGDNEIAKLFIEDLTRTSLPEQYLFEIWIDDELIYPQGPSQEHNQSKARTQILIPSYKLVYGFVTEEEVDMFGPYVAEVLVWQK